jgi:O-antigen/teichoic acid export membrane protein
VNADIDTPKKNSMRTDQPAEGGGRRTGGRLYRVLHLLSAFFLGQGALQGVSLLASLYLVRTLSITAYAQFGLAFGFQTTASILMDFGFASTIIPLVGERFEDQHLVGRYVRAAKHLRDLTFWLTSPFVAIIFLLITYKHHWGASTQILLLFSVLLSLYSSGKVSYFSAPLFLYRRFRSYYVPQTLAGLGRLATYIVLGTVGLLNAWGAAILSALNLTTNGWLIGQESKKYFVWPDHNDASIEKEVVQYILPAAPAIVLGAFHGQISLFLISIFGGTTSIAEVAALGRLAQIFTVFMTFNIVIVEPYVARLPETKLRGAYLKLLVSGVAAAVALSTFAFLEPGFFIFILGPKYQGLRDLIGWVITTACINYVAGLMWIMNRSRKWVFWRGAALEIALVLLVQIGFLVVVGVHTTRQAVFFSFASSFCYVLTHGYIAVYGHSRKASHDVELTNDDILSI